MPQDNTAILRDSLLESFSSPPVAPVKFCGHDLFVKKMTGKERDRYEKSRWKQVKDKFVLELDNTRAKLVTVTLCDENGKRVFNDIDVDRVGELDHEELDRAYEAAIKLNGLDKAAIEDAEKNSETDPTSDSGSD